MWCKSLTLEKYISFRRKWFFWPPFLSVSPFLLLNLARRQCYAYAIGLYTRPEIKSWPDVKFCAHAQCVLPRCYVHKTKFKRTSSLEYYHMTFIGKTKHSCYNYKRGPFNWFFLISRRSVCIWQCCQQRSCCAAFKGHRISIRIVKVFIVWIRI